MSVTSNGCAKCEMSSPSGSGLPRGDQGVEVHDVGVRDELRVVWIVGRREQIRVVDERRLGRADHLEVRGQLLERRAVLDRVDLSRVRGRELADELLVRRELDLGCADIGHVLQAVAQLLGQLAVDEPVQHDRDQHADQRADEEEGERELASEPQRPQSLPHRAGPHRRAARPDFG